MDISAEQSLVQVQAEVIGRAELAPGYCRLVLHAPAIAATAHPGQFVQIRAGRPGSIDPLLARPLSIQRAVPSSGALTLLFKVVGRGTALLAAADIGASLTLLGPLGNGFAIPASTGHLALLAGGVGMPPLFFLAERLRQARPALEMTLFYGGRHRADLLCLPEWEALGVSVVTATEDGSHGYHGLVTAPFAQQLTGRAVDFLAACGPRPMLRAVQRLALAHGIPGQLSLEARMACGVGACLGCVCATLTGHRRVCVDGPVFALEEVTFDV